MRWKLISLLAIVAFLWACNNPKNQAAKSLIGHWQLVNISSNQKVDTTLTYKRIMKQMILSTSLDINKDGTITSFIWGSKQTGHWKLKNNKLIVTDSKGKETFRAKIVKLTDNQLILFYKQDSVKVLMYFRKDLLQ